MEQTWNPAPEDLAAGLLLLGWALLTAPPGAGKKRGA